MRFIQPPTKKTKKCDGCGLYNPIDVLACEHCTGLLDQEVAILKKKHQKQINATANLGKYFGVIAILIFILMIMLSGS